MDPIKYFTLSMIISILGIRGILLNRRNIPIMSMPIEAMLLAVNFQFFVFSAVSEEGLLLSIAEGGSISFMELPLPDLNQPAPALTDAELAQETEANAAECARILFEICEEAKTVARNAGVTDPRILSNIEDAVKYLADVEEVQEEARIPVLRQFFIDLHQTDLWVKIDKECKRWGGRGIC
ncbi:NADH-ubiquinone oxidoreductase chain 4L [Linum perenne]